ncbi:DEAD/DEAH box helicase [Desulforegula conservatrix]|uniref:DEAD/DEAH box helicase n=1 Tax=Desulforegula conservatrix TaxID=153026 RepID=UPI000408C59A|nr:DEAD/DEAH box helicase [Desulforegula conservatrix]
MKKYLPHKKNDKGRYSEKGYPKDKKFHSKIKPDIDPRLKSVFKEIGTPEPSPFHPDPFQLEAVAAVIENDCLVTAPTGSGKTWIAETAIRRVFDNGGRSWYASPLKALSNSIYNHFCHVFGQDNVGILTGDRQENPDAPIIVGTTEILRNQLYDSMHKAVDIRSDLVVMDEAHYIGDEERGVVWEEVIIYLPIRVSLLLLSATIGNAGRIAEWIGAVRAKECVVVSSTERPVPLFPLFFHPCGTIEPLVAKNGKKTKGGLDIKVIKYLSADKPPLMAPPGRLPPMGDIIRVLRKFDLLPAIFFLKSRSDCDGSLELCDSIGLDTDPERKLTIKKRIDELTRSIPHLKKHKQMWHLEHLGVGSHHGGQLPGWKIVVETLMSEGLLDAVFATSTVAAGVNFPARTVVISNSDRFNGVEFIPLGANDYHQMSGRAGRRGMDKIGFVMALPGKFMDLFLTARLTRQGPGNILSQIRVNFSMTLNLLLSHKPEQIKELLQHSLATFEATYSLKQKSDAGKGRKIFENSFLWDAFLRHLDFLVETGFVEPGGSLTSDGYWASQLRIDHPLLVAEGLRTGLFSYTDPALLAGAMALFVNDREFEEDSFLKDSEDPIYVALSDLRRGLRPFLKHLKKKGFVVSPLYVKPAIAIYRWAKEEPWEKVCNYTRLAEGDMARLVSRTADNLRHLRGLGEVFPHISESAEKAIEMLMRDPVVTFLG